MKICMYEGYLRNRKALRETLSVAPCENRREEELSLLKAAWQKWGRDLVRHLRGAFALAFLDAVVNKYWTQT